MKTADDGSATAEMAVALPAVVLLLTVGVLAIAAVTTKLGCVAIARDAALAAARGQQPSAIDGVTVVRTSRTVSVTVKRGPTSCRAVAAVEPGIS